MAGGAVIALALDQIGHPPDRRRFVVNAKLTLRRCTRLKVLC
jgi:hypothetical protein